MFNNKKLGVFRNSHWVCTEVDKKTFLRITTRLNFEELPLNYVTS